MSGGVTQNTNINKKYEITSLIAALIIAGMSGVLYFETTESAKEWYQRWSGIIANIIINFFVTKRTIDYFAELSEEKNYKGIAAASSVATLSYLPQIIISWMEAPADFNLGMKIFATSATGLSGAALYAFAVAQLPGFAKKVGHTLATELPYCGRVLTNNVSENERDDRATKAIVLTNLRALRERIRVANYHGFDFNRAQSDGSESLLASAFRLAELDTTPKAKFSTTGFCISSLSTIMKMLLQVTTSVVLAYGAIGYTCDTERSLREDFHIPAVGAVVLANALMFLQYVLALKGGFSLVSGITDNLSAIKYGKLLTNDYRLGGIAGSAAVLLAPLVSGVIASFSGYTGEELYNEGCSTSLMKGMTFRGGNSVVNYSNVGFNGIYDVMAFCWIIRYCVENLGSVEDKNYMELTSHVDKLIQDIETTNDINAMLARIDVATPGIAEILRTSNYFEKLSQAQPAGFAEPLISTTRSAAAV